MDCKHKDTAVDAFTRARSCTSCGLVITESELVDAAFLDSSTTGVYQKTGDSKYWKQFQLMKDLATRFSLGESVVEQARHIFVQLAERNASLVSMGVKGNQTAGICVLLANRKSDNAAALSLADIAGALGESVSSVGQYLKMLKKQAPELVSVPFSTSNHGAYIERFYEEAVKPELINCKLAITDQRALLSLAESVCQIAQDGWLDVGRKPEPFILACLLLAVESVLCRQGSWIQVAKRFGKKQKTNICDKFSLPHRTVEQRHAELVQFLVRECSSLMPWDVNKNNVLDYLSDLVKIVEKIGIEYSADPPAFIAAQKRRRDMERRIEASYIRAVDSGDEAGYKSFDEMDELLDELLRYDVELEEVASCSNMGQLYALLSQFRDVSESEWIDETI